MEANDEWLQELAHAVSDIPDPGVTSTVSADTAHYLTEYVDVFGEDEDARGLPDNFRVNIPVGVVRELVRGMR